MVSTHSPIIKLFAGNYLAQLILGFLLAFALQQAIAAITNAEEFRAFEVWFAVDHAMNQKYSNYPRFNMLDGMSNVTIETRQPRNFRDGNKTYKSINEAILSLPPIPVKPVVNIGKTELDLWPEEQVRTFAKDLSISSAENEKLQALKVKILKKRKRLV